jgi:ankyrin repeat protein
MFRNPVSLETGHVYEKSAIDEWLQKHSTDPITNVDLKQPGLRVPAVLQRQQVQQWLDEHPNVSAEHLGWSGQTRDLPPAQTPIVQALQVDADPTAENLQDMDTALKCPISQEYMRDPVVLSDVHDEHSGGHTYERRFIANYLRHRQTRTGSIVDPSSNVVISQPRLTINWAIRKQIQQFMDEHPDFKPEGWPNRDIPPSLLNANIFDCIKKLDIESLKILLSEGEDIDTKDGRGNTAIGMIVELAHVHDDMHRQVRCRDIFDLLIERNANIHLGYRTARTMSLVELLLTHDIRHLHARFIGVTHEYMLRKLVDRGIDLATHGGFLPLKMAVSNNRINLAEVLLARTTSAVDLGRALVSSIDKCFDFGKSILTKLLSMPWSIEGEEQKYFFKALQKCITHLKYEQLKYMLQQYKDSSKADEIADKSLGVGFDLDRCLGKGVYELSGTELKNIDTKAHETYAENVETYGTKQRTRKIMKVIMDSIHGKTQIPDEFEKNQTHVLNGSPYLSDSRQLLITPSSLKDHSSLYRSIQTGKICLANILQEQIKGFADIGHCIIALMLRGDYESNEILFDDLLKQFNWDDQLKHKDNLQYYSPSGWDYDTILTKALKCPCVDERYIHDIIRYAIENGKSEYLQLKDGYGVEPLYWCKIPSIATLLVSHIRRDIDYTSILSTICKKPFGLFLLHEMLRKEDRAWVLNQLLCDSISEREHTIAEYLVEKGARLSISQVSQIWNRWYSDHFRLSLEFIGYDKQIFQTAFDNALSDCECKGDEILLTRDWRVYHDPPKPHKTEHNWSGNLLHFICRFPLFVRDSRAIIQAMLSKEGVKNAINGKCTFHWQGGKQKFTPLQLACTNLKTESIHDLLSVGAHFIPRGALPADYPINLAFDELNRIIRAKQENKLPIKAHGELTEELTEELTASAERAPETALLTLEKVDVNFDGVHHGHIKQLRRQLQQKMLMLQQGKTLHYSLEIEICLREMTPLLNAGLRSTDHLGLQGRASSLLLRSLRSFISHNELDMDSPGNYVQEVKLCTAELSSALNLYCSNLGSASDAWILTDTLGLDLPANALTEGENAKLLHLTMKILDMYKPSRPKYDERQNDWNWVGEIGLALTVCVHSKPDIGLPIVKRIVANFQLCTFLENFAQILHETIKCQNTAIFDFVVNYSESSEEIEKMDYHPLTHCIFRVMEMFSNIVAGKLNAEDDRIKTKENALKHILSRLLSVTRVIPAAVVHALFLRNNFESLTCPGPSNGERNGEIIKKYVTEWANIRKMIFKHRGFNINAKGNLHLRGVVEDNETLIYRKLKRLSCLAGHSGLTDILDLGGNVNIGCGPHEYTAFHQVVLQSRYNDNTVLNFLWKKSKEPLDVNVTDYMGNAPLHFAHNVLTAKFLLERGADPKLKNDSGQTPLQFCQSILEAFDSDKFNKPEDCDSFKAAGFSDFLPHFTKPRLKRIKETVTFLQRVGSGEAALKPKKQMKRSTADVLKNPTEIISILDDSEKKEPSAPKTAKRKKQSGDSPPGKSRPDSFDEDFQIVIPPIKRRK